MFFVMILCLIFILAVNPVLLIVFMLIFLLNSVLLLSFLMNSYFYSYIVFLLFVSGLMILFMYICSIVLNEKLSIKVNKFYYLVFCSFIIMNYLNMTLFLWIESLSVVQYYDEFIGLMKFYVFSTTWMSVFFVFYLFICLIVIYEILKKSGGPMRMKS